MKDIFPSFGTDWFPTGNAGKTPNRVGITPILRCRHCGHTNDTRTTAWSAQGEGLTAPDSYGSQDVNAGCAFCGSLFWRKTKPPKLPDDQFLPSRDNYKGR